MTYRAILLVAVLLLAGCSSAGTPTPDSTERALEQETTLVTETSTPTPTPTPTSTPTPELPENPWQADPVVVGSVDVSETGQDYEPLVRAALAYWENHSEEYAGQRINYTYEPDTYQPDVTIRFVPGVADCGHSDVSDTLGCAPLIDSRQLADEPTVIRIKTGYTNETTLQTIKHEVGHTLGLVHGEGPAFMNSTTRAVYQPLPDAVDRAHPWESASLSVYVDYSNVPSHPRHEYERQVSEALSYFDDGAEGTVSTELSFTTTSNRSTADLVIEFPDEMPCGERGDGGSCGAIYGKNLDEDPPLEYYSRVEITVSNVDGEAIGWHVGYWLAQGLGLQAPNELPPPFVDADYDDRRSYWWK